MTLQLHIESVDTDDESALDAWDDFLLRSPRGHYCQLSTWLRSFEAYGGTFRILVARLPGSDRIVGGIGLLRFGNRVFGLMSAPGGLIVDTGYEEATCSILESSLREAKRAGMFLLQLQFPCSSDAQMPALLPTVNLPNEDKALAGTPFRRGKAPGGMFWMEFPKCANFAEWREHMLCRFGKEARHNVRFAERKGLESFEARTPDELRQAFSIIEGNGRMQGYTTRSWRQFGTTLIEQVAKRHAIVLVTRHEGRSLGALYALVAGQRCTGIMSGSVRSKPDLKVGHFNQWAGMCKAKELGLRGYDFQPGGPPSVKRFKMSFNPTHIRFVSASYYVLSPVRYAVFKRIYPYLDAHKGLLGRILNAGTRFLGRHRP